MSTEQKDDYQPPFWTLSFVLGCTSVGAVGILAIILAAQAANEAMQAHIAARAARARRLRYLKNDEEVLLPKLEPLNKLMKQAYLPGPDLRRLLQRPGGPDSLHAQLLAAGLPEVAALPTLLTEVGSVEPTSPAAAAAELAAACSGGYEGAPLGCFFNTYVTRRAPPASNGRVRGAAVCIAPAGLLACAMCALGANTRWPDTCMAAARAER